jgi:hypothetical protein
MLKYYDNLSKVSYEWLAKGLDRESGNLWQKERFWCNRQLTTQHEVGWITITPCIFSRQKENGTHVVEISYHRRHCQWPSGPCEKPYCTRVLRHCSELCTIFSTRPRLHLLILCFLHLL